MYAESRLRARPASRAGWTGPRRQRRTVPVPRPRLGRAVHSVVRRGHDGRRYRSTQDPAAMSAGELLRRTVRVDGRDRSHRPDADLRRATPAPGSCRVRPATTTPRGRIGRCRCGRRARHRRFPSRFMAESGVDQSWAASSVSTRRQAETAGQAPRPRSGTRQAWSCWSRRCQPRARRTTRRARCASGRSTWRGRRASTSPSSVRARQRSKRLIVSDVSTLLPSSLQ
jgi:hypothetical protein